MTITFLRNHDRPFDKVFREKQLREVLKQGKGHLIVTTTSVQSATAFRGRLFEPTAWKAIALETWYKVELYYTRFALEEHLIPTVAKLLAELQDFVHTVEFHPFTDKHDFDPGAKDYE